MSPGEGRGGPLLITGGGQGIGRGIVDRAVATGTPVTVLEVDSEAARELGSDHAGSALEVVVGDVADEDDVVRAVDAAVGRFGGLAALVNNAGIGVHAPLESLRLEDWNRVLGVDLTGAFLTMKHAARHLRAVRGAIVNVASTRALMSEPDTEAYAASKGGLLALTHAAAISLGPEIRVNAVSPGWIEVRDRKKASDRVPVALRDVDHRQHPAGRVGVPEDVVEAVWFLLSDRAAFVTGQNLVVDGGMTRKMIYAA